MLRKWSILLITIFYWHTLVAQGSSQTTWITVTDKFGNHLGVQKNKLTGAAHRVWGLRANISQYGVSASGLHKGNINDLAKRFLADYQDIIKITPNNLTFAKVETGDGCWYLSYEQTYHGIRVNGTHVGFTIEKDGGVKVLGADIYPIIEVSTKPEISKSQALEIAKVDFKTNGIETATVERDISLLIYPEISNVEVKYYLVYSMELFSNEPTKQWFYFVDALNGKIIRNGSVLRDAIITIHTEMQYWPEYEGVNYTDDGGIQGTQVTISNYPLGPPIAQGQTDSNGDFVAGIGSGWYFVFGTKNFNNFSNSWARITNGATNTFSSWFTNPGYTKKWAIDETNVYHHVNVMHDYWTSYPFYYSAMNYRMDAGVHAGQGIRTASNGTLILFGTNLGVNWARFSDVIYHEYTHNVVYHIYGGWIDPKPYDYNSEAYAMDEGFPDYYACSKNDDPLSGDEITGVPDLPRNIDINWVRPDHWIGDDPLESPDPQLNGRIIAGACWDMRESSMGITYTDKLVYKALVRTPHAYDFDAFADNVALEDGNLTGGVNYNTIVTSFNAHGINTSCQNCHGSAMGKLLASGKDSPDQDSSMPLRFSISQNHPNPFNPITTISYDLPEDSFVELKIYDLLGKEVRTLCNKIETAGSRSIQWDGKDENGNPISTGLYLYRISSRSIKSDKQFSQTMRMVLLR